MVAEPDEGAPRPTETPVLGELLVERGLLTPGQLATALEEQRETGRRLGDLIVELGFTTAVRVAQALATQHGGLFKSEYGTALGFDTGAEPGPAQPPPVTAADPAGPSEDPAMPSDRVELRLVPEAAPAPAHLESELTDARERLQVLTAELDAAIRARDAATEAAAAADDARARAVVERDAAIAEASALSARIETLEAQSALRSGEAGGSESRAPLPAAAESEPADRHLVFLAGSSGYRLLERSGPVPDVGSIVTLADSAGTTSSQLVVRVGAAPLPGSVLRCAYLLPG